jgi:V/A-type H+-transporting ATPase subunit D
MSELQYTRMELLRLKNRLNLANKGYNILKKKLDVLIINLFDLIKKLKQRQSKLLEKLNKAEYISKLAKEKFTLSEIDIIANYNKLDYSLDINTKNVMGVKVPIFKFQIKSDKVYYPYYRSIILGDMVKNYREIILEMIELAEIESSIKNLLREIKKTKRRVNSLEYIIIPKLKQDIRLVLSKLEEMERENFVKLKVIKDAQL